MNPCFVLCICNFVDDIDQRNGRYTCRNAPNQSVRYVFVARVLLGNSYMCKGPRAFKRTPCMQSKCYSDSCNHHTYSGSFDSVIEIKKGGYEYQGDGEYYGERSTSRMISGCADDRDFSVYSPDQSYPDFLVEYQ